MTYIGSEMAGSGKLEGGNYPVALTIIGRLRGNTPPFVDSYAAWSAFIPYNIRETENQLRPGPFCDYLLEAFKTMLCKFGLRE